MHMRYKTNEDKVYEFQKAMGQDINVDYSADLLRLRMALIEEEMKELKDEVKIATEELENKGSVSFVTKTQILKELCDLQYVVSGFAVTFGLPIEPAFNRIHASNMSKLEDGKPVKNEQGKVMKGKNYEAPSLTDLICDMGKY